MDLLPPSQHLLFVVACTVVILISSNASAISASLSADFFSVKLLYFSWDTGFFEGRGGFLLSINVTGETKNKKKALYLFHSLVSTLSIYPLLSCVAEGNVKN